MRKNRWIALIMAISMLFAMAPATFAEDVVPTVTKTTPGDGATEIPLMNTVIEVNFSTVMDEKTVTTANITMTPARIQKIEYNGDKKAYIYCKKLLVGTTYTLSFSKGIKSKSGTPISPYEMSFTTTSEYPKYHQLINGDMEDPTNISGLWQVGNAADPTIEEEGKSGNHVLKFTPSWDEAPVLQDVYMEPGVTYQAKVKVKATKADQAWFCFMHYEVGNSTWYHKECTTSLSAGEWTEMIATYTTPAILDTSKNMDIRLVIKTKGNTVYVDDFQFYELGCDVPAPETTFGDVVEKTTTLIEDSSKDSNYQKLQALGIYGKREYSDITETVTRENFAKYTAKLLGYGSMTTTGDMTGFADLDDGYEGYAGVMESNKLMLGDVNGNFNPYAEINFNDAVRALIVALGYGGQLENSAPLNVAASLGITKGVSASASKAVTYKALNVMLANALDVNVLAASGLTAGGTSYKVGDTALEALLDTTERKGIVEATPVSSLNGPDGIREGWVRIDGIDYKTLDVDASSLLGKRVTFYTKEINDDETVVLFADIEKFNTTVLIDAKDISGYSEGSYYYYTSDNKARTKKATVAKNKYLIYNNRYAEEYTTADMVPVYGSVELIDNNNDNKFDVVKVLDYQTYVVKSINKQTGEIVDKFEDKTLYVDLAGTVIVKSGSTKSNFDAIGENNVLSVLQSKDMKYVVIYRSNNVVNGTVNSVEEDADGNKYVVFYDEVHGREITTLIGCISNYKGCDDFVWGEAGVFYIDHFGNIAAFKKTLGDWKFGYLIKTNENEDESLILKMLTTNDKIEKIETDSVIRIDTKRYKTLAEANEYLEGIVGQVIQYKQDADGKITHLTTLNNKEKGALRQICEMTSSVYYFATTYTLGNKCYIDADTKVFCVPKNVNNLDEYRYKSAPAIYFLQSGKTYAFTAYSATDNDYTASLLVMKDRLAPNNDIYSSFVVSKIEKTLNADNEVVTKVTGMTSSSSGSVYVDNTIDLNNLSGFDGSTGNKLEVGDIVRYKTRYDGLALEMVMYFKGNEKRMLSKSNPTSTGLSNPCKVLYGKATAKENGLVRIDSPDTYEVINAAKLTKIISWDGYDFNNITVNEIEIGANVAVVSAWDGNNVAMIVYR